MSSIVRIDSNRRNGAKSRGPTTPDGKQKSAANAAHATGPRTPEGKARVSRNAIKHGILAQSVVLPTECPRAFEEDHAGFRNVLMPRNFLENQLLMVITHAHWRRKRSWFVEKDLLTEAVEAQGAQESCAQENSESTCSPSMRTARAFRSASEGPGNLKSIRRYEVTYSREFQRYLGIYDSRRRDEAAEHVFTKQTEPKAG